MFSLFFDKRIGFFPHTLLLIFVIRKDWQDIKVLLLIHAVNIPLLSALILTLVSWFTWDSFTKAWYCTAGEFSIINYLKVCLEVTLISFFIFILQLYRLRNNRLQQELDEVRAINQLLEDRQTVEPKDAENEMPSPCVLRLRGLYLWPPVNRLQPPDVSG